MVSLAKTAQDILLSAPEVTKLSLLRRPTSLFNQNQPADTCYLIGEGLIKVSTLDESGEQTIIQIAGPGDLVGDDACASSSAHYHADAEVLAATILYRIPRAVLLRLQDNPAFMAGLLNYILEKRWALTHKLELLVRHDVESRILHYLAELAELVPMTMDVGYELPLTQSELANLIGATRETTSTTLNQLERRGLVKLSRRLLVIPSLSELRTNRNESPAARRTAHMTANGAAEALMPLAEGYRTKLNFS